MGGRSRKPRTLKDVTVTPEDPKAAGALNIWPIVNAEPGQLAEEVKRGDHDAYLDFLGHCDRARKDGRAEVQQAIAARRKLRAE